jgi:hypothetical protein
MKAKTFQDVNALRNWLESDGAGPLVFFSTNLSGGHDVIYLGGDEGGASLKSGSTPAERAVISASSDDKPLNATQITAAGGRTFTFDAASRTLTLSTGDLLADGYQEGMLITIAGATSNNGTYKIASLTATVITIDAGAWDYSTAFVDEGPLSATATLDGEQYGYGVGLAKYIDVVSDLPDAGTSLDWQLYLWDPVSENWFPETTTGVTGVTVAASPEVTRVDITGYSRVAVVTTSLSGTFTVGYSIWLKGVAG